MLSISIIKVQRVIASSPNFQLLVRLGRRCLAGKQRGVGSFQFEHLNQPCRFGTEPIVSFWQCKLLGIQGVLFWGVNEWRDNMYDLYEPATNSWGDGILIYVEDDAVVPVLHESADDIGAHPSESDHGELHWFPVRRGSRTARRGPRASL